MNSKEFTKNVLRTECLPTSMPISKVGLQTALTMAVACSDVMDLLKKLIVYGKPVNHDLMRSRLDAMGIAGDFLVANLNGEGKGKSDNSVVNIRLLHAAIGMFTESGELLSALQKQIAGEGLDKINFGEETGDLDWYKAIAHDELEIPEEVTRAVVISKLAQRYPDKFTSEAALNRDLKNERYHLEHDMADALEN